MRRIESNGGPTVRFLLGLLYLCLLACATAFAGDVAPDLLSREERAWLAAHPKIVLGAGDTWYNMVTTDARGSQSGFLVDYIDLLNRKLGTNIGIEVGPWLEIVKKAELGEIDGLAVTAPLDERRTHFLFTEVFNYTPVFIYLRTADLQKQNIPLTLDELRGRRVGYLKGILRESRGLAAFPEITSVPVDSHSELARRLLNGELDAVIATHSLEFWRAGNGVVGIAMTRIIPEIDAATVISINKERPQLVAILNKGLAAIAHPELQAINRRWFGNDYADRIAAVPVSLTAEERAWLADHGVIRIGIDPRWAPVEFLDATGAAKGMSIAFLQRMSKALGVRFDVRPNLAWSEALHALGDRNLDALAAITATSTRRQQIHFTNSYLSFPAAIFSAADITYIGGPEGLQGKTVAVIRGEALEEWLQENWPDLHLLPVADTLEALKTITEGRAYAFVGNLVTTSYYIGQSGLTQIRVAGDTPFVYHVAMGVRDDWPILAGILQKGIDAIPVTEREAIYRDWISIRYEHRFDPTVLWIGAVGTVLILALVFAERTLRLNRSNSRLQVLAKELSLVEERERRRLAGELHDSPMQKLALARLHIGAAGKHLAPEAQERLSIGIDLMRDCLAELRSLQFELSPPMLYQEGLGPALRWLAAHAEVRLGVTFSYGESGTLPQLPQELGIALFQCARELVFNVAKHASATTGSIELTAGHGEVLLTVADDGKGFVSGDAPRSPGSAGGYGLFSIRERVALFGGQLSIVTAASGSRVTLRMPVAVGGRRGTVDDSVPRRGGPGNPQAQA